MTAHHLALPLLLMLALLQGCTLSQAQIRHADTVIAASTDRTSTCDRADRCAVPSPLLEAADDVLSRSTPSQPVHIVSLLGPSESALAARINLVRAARRSINVQTYIWADDDAGMLMLDELIHAARRGVHVRVLADQLGSFGDLPLLDRLARASPNFELKLYNPTFQDAHTSAVQWIAGVACCFFKLNQRMHNKVLLVDDSIGITGGRNYQNRYFDWDDAFDYVDRDVLVGGPAARDMADSFELFWHHPRAVALTHLRDLNRYIVANHTPEPWTEPQYDHVQRVYRVQQEATDNDWLASHVLAQGLYTGNVAFFSDLPAKTEQPRQRDARAFTAHVMQMVAGARDEVVLQTPYLVLSKRARAIFEDLRQHQPPPRIVVSTNSLASTDAFAVYAMSYKHRKRYLTRYGFEIYELKPHAPGPAAANAYASIDTEEVAIPGGLVGGTTSTPSRRPRPAMAAGGTEARGLLGSRGSSRHPAPLLSNGRRFGLHAKSIVVDDRFAMVGSHNFDPRSDHYNTEAGVIVYDRRFAAQLRRDILRDTAPENAWVVAPRRAVVPLLSEVNQTIGDVSERLPLFDLWPFRYATSYDLKPGCQPLRIDDPAFHSCYTPVGDFPDVALSPKLIYTRLITAFGVGVTSIL
ncbi:MAG: phospholipase D family protein [Rhodanobacter sp.]